MPKPSGIDLLPPWQVPPAHSVTSAATWQRRTHWLLNLEQSRPLAQRLVGVSLHASPCWAGPGTTHAVSPWLPTTAHTSSGWVHGFGSDNGVQWSLGRQTGTLRPVVT